jgi:hypothetical protein
MLAPIQDPPNLEVQAPVNLIYTKRFYLKDLYSVDVLDVVRVLNGMLNSQQQLWPIQKGPRVQFQFTESDSDASSKVSLTWQITGMSHRAKLITGFYDCTFPIKCTDSLEGIISAPSVPYNYHGNKLYLMSNQGNVIQSCNVQSPGVLLRINEFLMATLPVLIKPKKEERDVVIGDGTSLRQFDIKLVDRWYEPVILLNPMIVTIKMKPILLDNPCYGS